MVIDFEKETEGVLVLCSKIGLKKYFADKEFDYNFPEGILPLVNLGIIAGLVTESGDEVKGKIIDEAMNEYKGYRLLGQQNLFIEEEDELYVLSHSEFTQICSSNKGDIDSFSFWNDKIAVKGIRARWAIVFTHVKMRKNSSFMRTITQLIYTKQPFPYGEIDHIPAF